MKLHRAVVEDNNHPEMNGMVRVRVFGVHTESKEGDMNRILTEELPWAEIMSDPSEGLVSGIGSSRVPRKGTHVWVFFDADDTNKPIIIGSIDGVNDIPPNPDVGFFDPDAIYPLKDRIGEQDTNRLVRGETVETHDLVQEQLIETEGLGNDGAVIEVVEPELLTENADYTEIEVKETCGYGVPAHIFEIDNTPDNERIRRVHKLGAYDEYRPDGSMIQRLLGEKSFYLNEGEQLTDIVGAVQTYYEDTFTQIVQDRVVREFNSTYKQAVLEAVERIFKDTYDHLVLGAVTKVFMSTLDAYVKDDVTEVYDAIQSTTVTSDVIEVYNAKQDTTVTDDVTEVYNAKQSTTVTDDVTEVYNAKQSTTVTEDVTEVYKAKQDTTVTEDVTEVYKAEFSTTVSEEVTEMYKDDQSTTVLGTRELTAEDIEINTGDMEVNAGDVEINSLSVDVTSGMVTITAPIINLVGVVSINGTPQVGS